MEGIHRKIHSSVRWHKYDVVNFIIQAPEPVRMRGLLHLFGYKRGLGSKGALTVLTSVPRQCQRPRLEGPNVVI